MIRIENLYKSFGGIQAVRGISLSTAPKRITAIIGPNGAGKTTLFNLITGFLEPDSGAIYFKGHNLNRLPPYKRARLGIARTFQDLRLIRQMTVLENVLLARPHQHGESLLGALFARWHIQEAKHREQALYWLDFVGLSDKADDLAESLSYGQQKLLTLACSLASEAEVLLLDEPVAGVQPGMVERIVDYIAQLPKINKTVVFIEHNLEVVQHLAEWVIVMDEGKVIAEGEWSTVSRDAQVLEAYLA